MGFTVWVGEPDVTHQTSWPESTGKYGAEEDKSYYAVRAEFDVQ